MASTLALPALTKLQHCSTQRQSTVTAGHTYTYSRPGCRMLSSLGCVFESQVAVVVDPIQSVKGKVVIDAFRSINPQARAPLPVAQEQDEFS